MLATELIRKNYRYTTSNILEVRLGPPQMQAKISPHSLPCHLRLYLLSSSLRSLSMVQTSCQRDVCPSSVLGPMCSDGPPSGPSQNSRPIVTSLNTTKGNIYTIHHSSCSAPNPPGSGSSSSTRAFYWPSSCGCY